MVSRFFAALMAASAMMLTAQPLPNAPADPVFRSGVQLVQISVIAHDKQGKPVAGLRREDFQIFDNGEPRDIAFFLAERAGVSPAEPKTPGLFTNRASGRGFSVILIDSLLTDFGDPDQGDGSSLSRLQTLRMLRSRPAGEWIAIYALERGLRVICEFTSDRDLLERQLMHWKPSIDTPVTANAILAGGLGATSDDRRGDAPAKAAEFTMAADTRLRAEALDQEMIRIAGHLAETPGRKNLIWIARRWMLGPQALQKLKNANVAVYPIDVNGVQSGLPPPESMRFIAEQTGGAAYHNRNDIAAAIGDAMDDGRVSYTLGFYPSSADRASGIHHLEVRARQPGIALRYRTSYQPETLPPASPKANLARALYGPIEATSVPLKATATRAQDRLDVRAVVDLESLELAQNHDRRTGKIEIVARFLAADGKPAGAAVSQTLNLNLRPATYDAALRQGIAYHNVLKVPPKSVELRLLVANPVAGKTGTLTIPLSEVAAGGAGAK